MLIAALGIFLLLTGCPSSGSSDPDDTIPVDTTAPTVSATVPAADAVDVAINSAVTATFSEEMTAATVVASFSVANATGTVTYDAASKTATFTPAANFSSSTLYTATISTGAKDAAGNAMAAAKVWSFTTGVAADTTAPTVLSTVPASAATGVAVNSAVTATFSEPMNSATVVAGFSVAGVTGTVTYDAVNKVATFIPSANLANNTSYTATIAVGAKDLAGNALAAAKVWSFTTVAAAAAAPTVLSTLPAQSDLNVATTANITATFSEEMAVATMVGANFTVRKGATLVDGVVSFDQPSKTITFNPTIDLDTSTSPGTVYTATITTGATDLDSNALAEDYVWTFTTGSTFLGAINLLSAGDFVILAQSGITNSPTSAITGDLGISPSGSAAITGFGLQFRDDDGNIVSVELSRYATAAEVTGKVYASDMTGVYDPTTPAKLTTAVTDKQTAYNAAAASPATGAYLNVGGNEVNGHTFAPGKYSWGDTLNITGDITLSGGSADIWIFQMTGGLNVSSSKNIVLAGGAKAENIFWQVTTDVSIGSGAHFEGIILGDTQITMITGSSMNGRLFAKTLVALQSATVTQP